ncbi:MAG: twin-arginine translocase subunit TatC [Proteobacteria bacterium]|nr:twin-arginine translocase subunit TatC [Pseudomonadota bacterium]
MYKKEELRTFSFAEHFAELKHRLIFTLAFFVLSLILSYHFKEQTLDFLIAPLKSIDALDNNLIFTHITEPFFVYLKVTFWAGLFMTIPFIMLQIYLFASSGLFKKEKNFVIFSLIFGVALFCSGVSFVYFALMPKIFEFFLSFANNSTDMQFYAKISQYFDFSLHLMLAFGLAFQLPIVLLILNKLNLISYKTLQSKRKYSIIFIAFASAVLTPPDVFTQLMLIMPLVILYELTILLLRHSK